jgi:hypothetical protein
VELEFWDLVDGEGAAEPVRATFWYSSSFTCTRSNAMGTLRYLEAFARTMQIVAQLCSAIVFPDGLLGV